MADDQKRSHTLADHLLGQDVVHEHDGDADHDHDHFEVDPNERLEENPIWIQDHVTLVTVGIDIGSSGTQVIFSRINLRRYGEDLTSRYYVVSRETLFQSPVALTPYASDERIDDVALGAIIEEAYAAAGVAPRDMDTGVVILTGEALRRENAEAIAALFGQDTRDGGGVLAPQRLAGEDHRAGVDLVGMQARRRIGLVGDRPQPFLVDQLFALVGRERVRRLVEGFP